MLTGAVRGPYAAPDESDGHAGLPSGIGDGARLRSLLRVRRSRGLARVSRSGPSRHRVGTSSKRPPRSAPSPPGRRRSASGSRPARRPRAGRGRDREGDRVRIRPARPDPSRAGAWTTSPGRRRCADLDVDRRRGIGRSAGPSTRTCRRRANRSVRGASATSPVARVERGAEGDPRATVPRWPTGWRRARRVAVAVRRRARRRRAAMPRTSTMATSQPAIRRFAGRQAELGRPRPGRRAMARSRSGRRRCRIALRRLRCAAVPICTATLAGPAAARMAIHDTTTLHLRRPRPIRGRHGRRARRPGLLPPGAQGRRAGQRRPREGPGRGAGGSASRTSSTRSRRPSPPAAADDHRARGAGRRAVPRRRHGPGLGCR